MITPGHLTKPNALGYDDFVPTVPIPNSPFRVMVNTNDHPPPHVHVIIDRRSVLVGLDSQATCLEIRGRVSLRDERRARILIRANLALCREYWRKTHGR